jgi:hypothetical protein
MRARGATVAGPSIDWTLAGNRANLNPSEAGVPRGLPTSLNSAGLIGPLEWTRKPAKHNQGFDSAWPDGREPQIEPTYPVFRAGLTTS